jgi:hypothetical protein
VNGEFFARGERRGKSQTKDEAIYGVFLDGSDSDDDRRGKRQRTAADYSRPVAFRSTGQVVGGDQPPVEAGPQLPPERQRAQSEEADDVDRPSFGGLGLGSSRPGQGDGLGFTSGGSTAARGGKEEQEDDEGSVLPGAFGARYEGAPSCRSCMLVLQQHAPVLKGRMRCLRVGCCPAGSQQMRSRGVQSSRRSRRKRSSGRPTGQRTQPLPSLSSTQRVGGQVQGGGWGQPLYLGAAAHTCRVLRSRLAKSSAYATDATASMCRVVHAMHQP